MSIFIDIANNDDNELTQLDLNEHRQALTQKSQANVASIISSILSSRAKSLGIHSLVTMFSSQATI